MAQTTAKQTGGNKTPVKQAAVPQGTATGEKTGHKNEKVGEVVSTKMAKTIVVEVTRRVPHPVYKRIVSKRKKFYAHDEQQSAKVGDVVRIIECRPLSRLKRWELGSVIRRAVQVGVDHPALTEEADTRVKKTVKRK
jgi:small subunit ribosomal protein S17